MGYTALQERSEGMAAGGVSEYRGATMSARFAGPQAEFESLRSGCGVYDLGYRAKIAVTGGDRVRWLNGMVTNNIRDLAVGHGAYAFLLNPQGHILGDLYAYNRGESITVDTDRSQIEKILATFDHYIIMDDVEVTNLSQQLTSLGVSGPNSRTVLEGAGFTFPEMQALEIQARSWQGHDCTLVRVEDPVTYEIWIAPEAVTALWKSLLAAGAEPVGFEALEWNRVFSGIPRYGVDIRERDLPQETEQDRALNFNKGCYVGQEIVERIRSRGAVHRKFSGFTIENGTAVAPGEKVIVGDKEAGELTSVISLGKDQPGLALGYIRREAWVPGKQVRVGAGAATVAELPFRKL